MIVMNTLTAAVSEHSLAPQSITPTHMGDASGLYLLGGGLDDTAPIVSEIITGKTEFGSSLKKVAQMVYFAMRGEGYGELIVRGSEEYRYSFPVRDSGQSRCQPGKGIRENYLAFGYSNPDGDYFQIDRIEVLVAESKTRRV